MSLKYSPCVPATTGGPELTLVLKVDVLDPNFFQPYSNSERLTLIMSIKYG